VSHKLSTFLLLSACLLGMNPTLWGQNTNRVEIRGYLDPRTGEFHPLPQPVRPGSDAEPAATPTCTAASPCTGKFEVSFTITVDSTIASTAVISCSVSAVVEDDDGIGNLIGETAAVGVTRGTASTVSCTVDIPYSWILLSPASDTVKLTYVINVPGEAATATALLPSRVSSQEVSPGTTFRIPATGSTTTFVVHATI